MYTCSFVMIFVSTDQGSEATIAWFAKNKITFCVEYIMYFLDKCPIIYMKVYQKLLLILKNVSLFYLTQCGFYFHSLLKSF